LYAARREGVALQTLVSGPGYESPSYGTVRTIDASAILGEGVLHLFLINRSLAEAATVDLRNSAMRLKSVRSAELVTGPSAQALNTFDQPRLITNQPFDNIVLHVGSATMELPPLSAAAITFNLAE